MDHGGLVGIVDEPHESRQKVGRRQPHVGIEVKQQPGAGCRHSVVAALPWRRIEGRPGARHHDASIGSGDIDRPVRAVLIHDRHLRGEGLRLDGFEQVADIPLLVIGWHDDRHFGRVFHSVEAIMAARSTCAE